jgi:nucleoside-diphosphate-sugar epimerase
VKSNPLAQDLDHVLAHTDRLWEELRGQRIFITGGTGFFGCWLLESLAWANDKLGLDAKAVVLTRCPEEFGRKAPHLAAHPAIELLAGDVRTFAFPAGRFSHVIHAAAEARVARSEADIEETLDVLVQGTRRTLDLAVSGGARRYLLASSGAIYGRQPSELTHISEEYAGAPDPALPASVYGEGKRVAELLVSMYQRRHGLETGIARCFAFVGPYLPLDRHLAIGNFIRDGLQGGPIVVRGDGTPRRSYLYAGDLAVWLWTVFLRGVAGRPYNVGSENELSVGEAARTVARAFAGDLPVVIEGEGGCGGGAAERYVPSTQRAERELGLRATVGLAEGVRRTVQWHLGRD